MPGTRVSTGRMSQARISTRSCSDRSRSVRSTAGGVRAAAPICATPSLNDSIIVGIDLISVMIPPVATAPAPM